MNEDINLDSGSASVPGSEQNTIKESVGKVEVAAGATNDDVLQQVLNMPMDQLIPWEECWLPSRGLYYGWSDGMVQVRAMGQVADKIMATQRLAQSGQSLDSLFDNHCRFPAGFTAADLLLGDRTFLLYFLRGITHGNVYEFAVTCPNQECKAVTTQMYDLNQLAKTIIAANPSLGDEPFKIVLPHLTKVTGREFWVKIRFLRARDATAMLVRQKAKEKFLVKPGNIRNRVTDPRAQQQQQIVLDETITDNMERIIVNVMDNTSPFVIREFIGKMHAQDTAAIREWMRANTPGIDNTIIVECSQCKTDYTMELPITESFFRPANV